MMFESALLAIIAISPSIQANVFVDDFGDELMLKSAPRLVTSSQAAVSLLHMGMPKEFLAATWGSPYNRFSVSSQFGSSDASKEDVDILRQIETFTPGCFDDYNKCYTPDFLHPLIDLDLVQSFKERPSSLPQNANIILDFSNHYYGYDAIQNMTDILGIPAAHINVQFEDSKCFPQPNTDNYIGTIGDGCLKRSMLDVTERLFEFASFLGVDAQADRQDLCDATAEFQSAARVMQDKGIRFMIAGAGDFGMGGWSLVFANPLMFGSVRTYEELGLPILWPGSCPEDMRDTCYMGGSLPAAYEFMDLSMYFPKCAEEGDATYSGDCVKEPIYPIDVWILEGMSHSAWMTTPNAVKPLFKDLAYQQDQVLPLLADEGVFSHRSIASQLREMTTSMLGFERLHAESACSVANVVSGSHITFDDSPPLGGGEYACYDDRFHNQEYLECPDKDGSSPLSSQNGGNGLSGGATAAIIVSSVVIVLALVSIMSKQAGKGAAVKQAKVTDKNLSGQTQPQIETVVA